MTPKQEAFCQAVASGKNLSEAYRLAYDTAKMAPETVNRKAYELLENGKIAARIDALKAELAARHLWTREQSVKALVGVVNMPDKASDVVAAVKELNTMHGFNAPAQFEQLGPDGKPVGGLVTVVFRDVPH